MSELRDAIAVVIKSKNGFKRATLEPPQVLRGGDMLTGLARIGHGSIEVERITFPLGSIARIVGTNASGQRLTIAADRRMAQGLEPGDTCTFEDWQILDVEPADARVRGGGIAMKRQKTGRGWIGCEAEVRGHGGRWHGCARPVVIESTRQVEGSEGVYTMEFCEYHSQVATRPTLGVRILGARRLSAGAK